MKVLSQKRYLLIQLVLIMLQTTIYLRGFAQNKYCVEELKDLKLSFIPGRIQTFYSANMEQRATELKSLVERASSVLGDSLNLEIELTIAALGTAEWSLLLDKPYGLPTLRGGACRRGGANFPAPKYVAILPGGIDGPLFNDWMNRKDSLSAKTKERLQQAGVLFEQGGKLMIDFVALHELGHAYHLKFGIRNYVNFFAEFMADYLAYAFLRSTVERLDKKVLAVLAANVQSITPIHTSFIKWENFRSSEHPPTEAWYNSVVTLKAAEIFEQRGFEFLHAVRKVFVEEEGQLNTATILSRLDSIHPGILEWSQSLESLKKQ